MITFRRDDDQAGCHGIEAEIEMTDVAAVRFRDVWRNSVVTVPDGTSARRTSPLHSVERNRLYRKIWRTSVRSIEPEDVERNGRIAEQFGCRPYRAISRSATWFQSCQIELVLDSCVVGTRPLASYTITLPVKTSMTDRNEIKG